MSPSPIIIIKKIEKSNITLSQNSNVGQLNSTVRNCVFYCAYSKDLVGKLLQKQARDLLKNRGL